MKETSFDDSLSLHARHIVEEEESLLACVQGVLEAKKTNWSHREQELIGRLEELRELASKAFAYDLPALFQEMNLVRSLLEHPQQDNYANPCSPYFAHLRLTEEDVERDFCLGRSSFVDTGKGVRIVDWRYAPIARIFYRHREGDAFEEQLPGRFAEGVVTCRRVLVIHNRVLRKILTSEFILSKNDEERWVLGQASSFGLGGGAKTAVRAGTLGVGRGHTNRDSQADVSALLDAQQFEALSTPGDRPLLVLGSAGSGKTTVALHRLASLAYENRERYPSSRIQVVVPEQGLARLSQRLLQPLGIGNVSVKTLEGWFRERVQSVFKVNVKVCSSTPALVSNLKRHPALYDNILACSNQIKKNVPTRFLQIRREIAEWMTDRKFLNEIVDKAGGSLSRNAVEETVRHTMLQLAQTDERQYQGYDPQSLKTIDGRAMSEGTPQEYAGTVDSEDLPLFLFLKSLRDGEVGRGLAHLVVDEAEDVSLFELDILGKVLGKDRSATLSGDDAQQTYSSFCGWQSSLKAMNASEAAVCRLQTTYRCPKPIARLAQEVLGPLAPQIPAVSGREGVPIGKFRFSEEAHATLFLVDSIRDLVEREPQASVAVIARSIETAKGFHKLTEDIQEVRLVMNGEFSFQPGVDVTDVASVKGLEFDYVIVPDASCKAYPEDDDSRRAMHVVVTRASHQLWLISVGTPSPLLGTFSSFSGVEDNLGRINE